MAKDKSAARLSGMYDLLSEDHKDLTSMQQTLENLFTLHDYKMVDTPILEQTELFLRKSGGELSSSMYTFSGPGVNRISLRPEFTSPVIRLYIGLDQNQGVQTRWQYSGPVFRYYPGATQERRQFTQTGIELIGPSGLYDDADVMALACQGLIQSLNNKLDSKISLVIGHVGVVQKILGQFIRSERALQFLLNSLGDFRDGSAQQDQINQRKERLELSGSLTNNLNSSPGLPGESNRYSPKLAHFLLGPTLENPVGSRTPEEIISRIFRKTESEDPPDKLDQGLAFITELSQIHGQPQEVFESTRQLISRFELDDSPLSEFEELIQVLELYRLKDINVSLDFGLVRGIAYYTGCVFELQISSGNRQISVGGGGRYDGLIKALGGREDTPAIGFAYQLEKILEANASVLSDRNAERTSVLVLPRSTSAYRPALDIATELRSQGKPAKIEFLLQSLSIEEVISRTTEAESIILVENNGTVKHYHR